MSPVLRLVARVVEGELIRHSSHGSERRDHDGGDEGDGNSDGGLKWWGILLIVYISILFVVFLTSFAYYSRDEMTRMRNGHNFRVGKTALKAIKVATGIWVWIWVFKKRGWCGGERKKGNTMSAGTGPYEQLDARQARTAMGPSPSTPSSGGSRSTTPARYGTPVNHAIPYAQPPKSPGLYKTAQDGFVQHEFIPMKKLSPHPSPSLSPHHPPPPPYVSVNSPPPAELHGDDIQPYQAGRMY